MTGRLRRLVGRLVDGDLPPDFVGKLVGDERVLGVAELTDGGHVVATTFGLWLPDGDGTRRVGWHLISKANWENGALVVVEAEEADTVDGAVLLTDKPPRRLRLGNPGRVPEAVHARVTWSIKSRHHRDLPGGGAWVVQRSVAGQDGIVLQVRPDPGTDPKAARSLAAQVAAQVRKVKRVE
ncbi:MAG TPA: hypothetical protein VH352_24610 [Pseudonocardiaceae bacterium]|nr:hypothetical protein [Pseudonocardiaceae bacterium]